jgi:hypothetical protein
LACGLRQEEVGRRIAAGGMRHENRGMRIED